MMKKIKNFAFSLIELMVVITIVGLLALIAAPAYKNYNTSAKFAQIISVLNNLADRSIEYSASHAQFGNAQQLGLSTGDAIQVDDNIGSQIVPGYLTEADGGLFQVTDASDLYGGTIQSCGRYGYVWVSIRPEFLGLSADNGAQVFLEIDYWHTQGVIKKYVSYSYFDNNQSYTDNLFPSATNQNSTTDNSLLNFITNVSDVVEDEATCQS